MKKRMSLLSRYEFLESIKQNYRQAINAEKTKLLDGFISATGYGRTHAIHLLNKEVSTPVKPLLKGRTPVYKEDIKHALLIIWNAANQICSKRLIPFMPELIRILENRNHLRLSASTKEQLYSLSPATMDRIMIKERQKNPKGISTTSPGSLLKKQIQVRTFADWNEVRPGFFEADLVAHCGNSTEGSFLNTLTMVDMSSGWVEPVALLNKNSAQVIMGIDLVKAMIFFPILGVDTDNGCEFINYDLLNYCEKNKLTFTRSRAYRKNDQAHVEEKNGSVIRRIVGYERYEGQEAYYALMKLYSVLRLYINFFQPSLKLISKNREGAKVTKKYEKAQTPYQRLLKSTELSKEIKEALTVQYETLDPIQLLEKVSEYQRSFFQYAGIKAAEQVTKRNQESSIADESVFSKQVIDSVFSMSLPEKCSVHTKKIRKPLPSRTWRTRKDNFAEVWDSIALKLSLNPHLTAKGILDKLIANQPESFKSGQLRTLQRQVSTWRKTYYEQEKQARLTSINENELGLNYLSAAIQRQSK